MPGNNVLRVFAVFHYARNALAPLRYAGIGQVAQTIGFGAFYQAVAIQYSFFPKPDNDIVFGMSFAGIIRFKTMIAYGKAGIFRKGINSLLLVVGGTQLPRIHR